MVKRSEERSATEQVWRGWNPAFRGRKWRAGGGGGVSFKSCFYQQGALPPVANIMHIQQNMQRMKITFVFRKTGLNEGQKQEEGVWGTKELQGEFKKRSRDVKKETEEQTETRHHVDKRRKSNRRKSEHNHLHTWRQTETNRLHPLFIISVTRLWKVLKVSLCFAALMISVFSAKRQNTV